MSFFKGVLVVLRETHSKMHYLKYFTWIADVSIGAMTVWNSQFSTLPALVAQYSMNHYKWVMFS